MLFLHLFCLHNCPLLLLLVEKHSMRQPLFVRLFNLIQINPPSELLLEWTPVLGGTVIGSLHSLEEGHTLLLWVREIALSESNVNITGKFRYVCMRVCISLLWIKSEYTNNYA